MVDKSEIKIGLKLFHSGDISHSMPYEVVGITPSGRAIITWKNTKGNMEESILSDDHLVHYRLGKVVRKGYINLSIIIGTDTRNASKVYNSFKEAVDNRVNALTMAYIDTIEISWKE
jgi:hypothetical protein